MGSTTSDLPFDLFQPFNNFKFWKYANKRKKLKK